MGIRCFASLIALTFLSVQLATADTYILSDENNTVTDIQIADDGETNAIVSTGTGRTYVKGTMTILGDSTINNANRLEISAAITADSPYMITKVGSGQLLFMNDSSALGKIVITSGQVVGQNNAKSLNAINGVEVTGGSLQIWDLKNVVGTINLNGGTLQSAGANNSFIGNTILSKEATIDVTSSYTYTTTGSVSCAGDELFKLHKTNTGTWNIEGNVNVGYLDVAGGTIKVATGGTLTATQLMMRQNNDNENTYTLTVDGGTATFTGDDHRLGHWAKHTGVVNINSGSFSAANTTSVGWDGTGKLYQTGGTASFDTLDILRTGSLIELSGGTTTIGTLKIGVRGSGSQAAGGTVTFKGSSNVTLTNMYAYHQGTLNIQDSANVTVTNQAYFVQANNTCDFTINQTGGTFTVNGSLALGHYYYSNVTYNMDGGTLNVPNYDSGGQSGFWLAVDSDGTLNQSGGTINTGRLNLNARDARQTGTYVMTGGTLNVGTGGIIATRPEAGRYVIQLQKGTITAGASSLTANKGSWSSSLNMELTGTGDDRVTFKPESGYQITLSGVLSGDGGLIKDGAGTLEITGANTYTGATTINAGEVKLSGNGTLGTGEVINNTTLEIAVASEQTFANAVSGTGSVIKTGAGRLKINAAEGDFNVPSLTVAAGRLDMQEYLTGRLQINNGASFSPGNSIGKMTVDGVLTLGQASEGDPAQIIMEVAGSGADQNDQLIITGDLELTNGMIYLELTDDHVLNSHDDFTVLLSADNSEEFAPSFIKDFVSASPILTNLRYEQLDTGYWAITGTLDYDAVPEPSAWAMLLLGAFGLRYWRKRK